MLLLSVFPALAQELAPDRIVPDTAVVQQQYERSSRFYDRLQQRSSQSRLARKLYDALVSEDSRRADTLHIDLTLDKEISYFQPFEGREIQKITIHRNNIFNDTTSRRGYRSLANSLHTVTREREIRRNLLFKEGEQLSAALFARNQQLLRSLSYLAEVDIVVRPHNSGGVEVEVYTRDSWSINAGIKAVPHHRRYIDLFDNNFLGSGYRFDIGTYLGYKGPLYGGNMLEFHAPNIGGSFVGLDVKAGKGYAEHEFGVRLNRPFILPGDFTLGAVAEDRAWHDQQLLRDTLVLVRSRKFDGWAGKSWVLSPATGSFYLTGRAQLVDFFDRPEVRPDSNTRYHSHHAALAALGVYRETYYKGNMIYGYGRQENIPYGHKFELTGGHLWGEFADRWYTAFSAAAGSQIEAGYLRAAASLSTCWNEAGRPIQGALTVDFDGFSNLWRVRRNYYRQFVSLRYLSGFNRLRGEGERLGFRDNASLPGLRGDGHSGQVRLVINTETVMFTPIYFYGFRFVFFGYADLGWLGEKQNPFCNDFYTAFGVGVRLKNERLIFGTIQLRLGLAVNSGGFADYRHLRFTGQQQFTVPEFKAREPEFFGFR